MLISNISRKLRRYLKQISFYGLSALGLLFWQIAGAQQMMSLGSLQFILPNTDAVMQSREIRLKMAGSDISSYYYKMVGGIAFTQTAVPDMDVNSISLSFSSSNMTGYIHINGKKIEIPMDISELKPIVSFADSDYDVVMTMYGQQYGAMNNSPVYDILFHPAFLDTMTGLRLLQTDLMYRLGGDNWMFPISETDEELITTREYKAYNDTDRKLKEDGSSYSENAIQAYQEIADIIDGAFTSYIYTDIDQPIHFSIKDGQISFTGLPYYQFSDISTDEIDPVNAYYWYKSLFDSLDAILDNSPYLTEDMVKSYKEMMKPACDTFYAIADQPGKTDTEKADELMSKMQESSDNVYNELIYPLLKILFPMWVSSDDITSALKERPELIRNLNPVIYHEVDDVCHWSAMFRFIRETNPDSWKDFTGKVSRTASYSSAILTPVSQVNL